MIRSILTYIQNQNIQETEIILINDDNITFEIIDKLKNEDPQW